MKKLGLVAFTFLFVGCFSNSPTPQLELEKNVERNIAEKMKLCSKRLMARWLMK